MGYILTQEEYNDSLSFGPSYGESIHQSFYFDMDFQLNSITVRFGITTIDPATDLKFRCEVREASGDDYLLELDDDPIMVSSWHTDDSILANEYHQFELDRTELDAGTYFFSFVSNERIKYPIYFSLQNTGSYVGSLLKLVGGSGVYSSTQSLAVKIDGMWKPLEGNVNKVTIEETYMVTTIQEA